VAHALERLIRAQTTGFVQQDNAIKAAEAGAWTVQKFTLRA